MVKSLKNVSQADFSRNLAIAQQMVLEAQPSANVTRGPLHDIILTYIAAFAAANQKDIADALRTMNLGKLVSKPDSVSTEHVDRVLSNWMMQRKASTSATGTALFILSQPYNLIIPGGTKLASNDQLFQVPKTYIVKSVDAIFTNDELQLTKATKDTWAVNVPVVAITTGAATNLRKGTQLFLKEPLSPIVMNVHAAVDFTGGTDQESNAKILKRIGKHVGGKVLSNRMTIEALIAAHPSFTDAKVSIIGFGDPEMQRDSRGLWPGSTGGCVDIYVKPNTGYQTKIIRRLGTRIENNDWGIYVDRHTAPGLYGFQTIVMSNSGQFFNILECSREIDVPSTEYIPKLKQNIDGVFSPYQTVTLKVRSLEPRTQTIDIDKAQFDLCILYLNGLNDLERHLTADDVRSPCSDILVKAAIPCFTTIDITIQQHYDTYIDLHNVKTEVAQMINEEGFTNKLVAANITRKVHDLLPKSAVVTDLKLSGKVYMPNDVVKEITSSTVLEIPLDPTIGLTARTCGFFQNYNLVNIHLQGQDGQEICC